MNDLRHSRGQTSVFAAFADEEAFLDAVEMLTGDRDEHPHCFTPHPVDGLDELLALRRSRLPRRALLAGLTGTAIAFGGQYFAMGMDYPLNVGGRPLNSWPAFMPITFELTVLFAAITSFLGVFILAGLPKAWRPELESRLVQRASQDRFVVMFRIDGEAQTPSVEQLRAQLRALGATETEVLP